MREVDAHATPNLSARFIDADTGRSRRLPPSLRAALPSLGVEGVRFATELVRHRRLRAPGFDRVSPELFSAFAEWCEDRRLGRIGEIVEPWTTGFGYGFHRDIAALYVLKYLQLFGAPLFELLEDGYGGLFAKVARTLASTDIRCGVSIERIERSERTVHVRTDRFELELDALILASPFDGALSFLDATPVERDLFSRIRHLDYYVVGARVEGLPHARCLFFPEHFARERVGQPTFAHQRWPGEGLTLFYGYAAPYGDEVAPDWERRAIETTRALVERLGRRMHDAPIARRWQLFPHVSPAELAAGFYERLEALQGQRATYYCGELVAFSTVETVVDYARALVADHFAPTRLAARSPVQR